MSKRRSAGSYGCTGDARGTGIGNARGGGIGMDSEVARGRVARVGRVRVGFLGAGYGLLMLRVEVGAAWELGGPRRCGYGRRGAPGSAKVGEARTSIFRWRARAQGRGSGRAKGSVSAQQTKAKSGGRSRKRIGDAAKDARLKHMIAFHAQRHERARGPCTCRNEARRLQNHDRTGPVPATARNAALLERN